MIARCQKLRSPAKSSPAAMTEMRADVSAGSDLAGCSSIAQSQSAGSARPTRQKALVNGPTSAKRTKTGDIPIAIAPATRARKAIGAASTDAWRGAGATISVFW